MAALEAPQALLPPAYDSWPMLASFSFCTSMERNRFRSVRSRVILVNPIRVPASFRRAVTTTLAGGIERVGPAQWFWTQMMFVGVAIDRFTRRWRVPPPAEPPVDDVSRAPG